MHHIPKKKSKIQKSVTTFFRYYIEVPVRTKIRSRRSVGEPGDPDDPSAIHWKTYFVPSNFYWFACCWLAHSTRVLWWCRVTLTPTLIGSDQRRPLDLILIGIRMLDDSLWRHMNFWIGTCCLQQRDYFTSVHSCSDIKMFCELLEIVKKHNIKFRNKEEFVSRRL